LIAGKSIAADLGFLALMAAVYVAKLFPHIFIDVAPKLPANVLGTAMWIRTGLLAMLSIRKNGWHRIRLLPSRREWTIGFVHFLLFLPVGFILGTSLKFFHPKPSRPSGKRQRSSSSLFSGRSGFWPHSKEVFFADSCNKCSAGGSEATPVDSCYVDNLRIGASLVPSISELGTLAVIATVLGLFCGSAYLRSGSVRASMVTHALT